MIDERALEARLAATLGQPMTVRQRAALDGWVAAMLAAAVEPRRRFRLHFARSTVLAVGIALVLAATFGAWGAMRMTEAPYGMHGAEQYQAEVDAAKAVTPLPPGATWPARLDEGPDPHGSYGVMGGLQIVEFSAACLWFDYWLTQHATGTPGGRAAATAGVVQMREWRTFADPLLGDAAFIEGFAGLIDAARRGEADPIGEFVAINCGT